MRPFFFLSMVFASIIIFCTQSLSVEWESYTYSNDVYDVTVSGGKVLCATSGGLLEFDDVNKSFTKYTNLDGLLECPTIAVDVDASLNWWIAHSTKGVTVRSQTAQYRNFTEYEGIPGENLHCIEVMGDIIMTGTDDGVWSVDTNGDPFGGSLSTSLYLENMHVWDIAAGDTTVWYGTSDGLYGALKTSHSETTYHYTTADGLPSDNVTCVAEQGSLWVGTDNGVALYDDTIWIDVSSGLPSDDVRDLTFYRDTLWAATRTGAAFFNGVNWSWRNSGLPSRNLTSLAGGPSSLLYCGTAGRGIAEYSGTWVGYSSPGLLSNDVEGIATETDGSMWVVYDRWPGASRLKDGDWQHFNRDSFEVLSHYSKTVRVDNAGNAWFATWAGGAVERTVSGEWHVFTDTNGYLPTPYVSALDIDKYDNKWIASYLFAGEYGVTVLSSDNVRRELYDRIELVRTTDIAVDSSGNKWFASYSMGLHRLSDGGTPFDQSDDSWQSYQEPELPSDEIRGVAVDSDGDVWAATTGGVARIREGLVIEVYYATPGGLPSSFIYKMVPDWEGGMWFEHEYGITRKNPDGSWKNYTSTDGLVSDEITYLNSHLHFDTDRGALFAGTSGGLSRVQTGIIPSPSFDSIEVYPNPFIPSEGHRRVTFKNIPDGSTIRIYTMSGELVREIERVVNTLAYWDGKNNLGEDVTSGVYVFAIGDKKSGIVALVR